jgi:hypothetical protein
MPQHTIDVRVPHEIWVENTDLEIHVKSDGRLLGRVHISRGSIDWVPAGSQSWHRLRWERFAELMANAPKRPLPEHARTSVRRKRGR